MILITKDKVILRQKGDITRRAVHLEPPFWERGGCRGQRWTVPFEWVMVVYYRLYIVTVALSLTIWPQFVIECLWRSNQQGWGQNLGRKGSTGVNQIWTRSGRDMGLSYAEEIVSIYSAVWAQYTNMTERQTVRPQNGNIDCKIACQRCRLIIITQQFITHCKV